MESKLKSQIPKRKTTTQSVLSCPPSRRTVMMIQSRVSTLAVILAVAALAGSSPTSAQREIQPTNDLPNPYQSIEGWAKMPEGRTWGSTSAVDIDRDGTSIWVAERCGANSCVANAATGEMSALDPILHFDASGNLIKSFGAGMIASPHGIAVDRDGNIWVTDYSDNAPRAARGSGRGAAGAPTQSGTAGGTRGTAPAAEAAAGQQAGGATAPTGPPPGATKGHQIFKFSPDGRLLMTLGSPGGAVEPGYFYQPNDVLIAPNGDIFVSQGHGQGKSEVLKFSKDGKLIKRWGQTGAGIGEFDQPHALAMDSAGRLFVADRSNNRIQVLDQDGTYVTDWKQFSRPSGLYIDSADTLYVADSESESVSRNHDGWKRGIRIGSARDGVVKYFIPDPTERATNTSAAEGVAADAQGIIYGAEVGPKRLMKYVKR
jgi:DNA-binding beta-propeller fold protein YncE